MGGNAEPLSTLSRYQLIASQSEASLERLVDLARTASGCHLAFAALLGPTHRFERVVGAQPSEVERVLPLCAFTLLQPGPFDLRDLRQHPQLGADPLVQGPEGLRALAGAPLRSDGQALGVLCVMASKPRPEDGRLLPTLSLAADELVAQVLLAREMDALRKRHEAQLGRVELLEGVLSAARTLGIVSTNLSGQVQTWSAGAEALLLLPARLALGRSLATFVSETAPLFDEAREQVLAGAAVERAWSLRRADGSRFPASVALSGLRSEEGALTGLVAVVQDLSERRRLERAQDEFLATISHELRTPLTGIQGALALALSGAAGPVSSEVAELLRMADGNAGRLGRLVLDLLDLASLAEGGGLRLRRSPCELGALLTRAVELNTVFCRALEVKLDARLPSRPAWAFADPGRLEQVISNLVTNAARFSPRGETVHTGLELSPGQARIWVADQGRGVPEELRPRLFTRFFTTPSPATGQAGNGLGLSIARAIVEAHGGQLDHEPGQPRGSVFSFTLPTTPASDGPA